MKAKGARGFWEGFFKTVSFSIDQPLISQYTESRQSQGGIPMNYRPARESDLPSLVSMSQQAIAYFRVNGIDQWQKGEPNKEELCKAIKEHKLYVLENAGKAAAMITLAPGPELSYAEIDGAWLNQESCYAFHRVCVEDSCKGQGIVSQLFSQSEKLVLSLGFTNVRIDTHPDNRSMQRALEKNGYVPCGRLVLKDGSEAGDPRLAYQKILIPF